MQKRVYGHGKQGAGFGHTKIQGKALLVRGLNVLAAVVSTPLAAPVIAATRLRGGSANSARGAASLAAEAISAARQAGCAGLLVFRIDSAYYSATVLGTIRRGGACFSVTVPMHRKVRAAIEAIGEDAWTPITYPRAVWDEAQGRLISDAEVAEMPCTAFASKKDLAVTARLIIRRVRDLNRKAAEGQDELFTCWRYHAVLTDSPFEMIQAEAQHRDHAIIEQVFADLSDGPLAHLTSGHFPANAAWLTCAAICHNMTRAAATLAGPPLGQGPRRDRAPSADRRRVLGCRVRWPVQSWTVASMTSRRATWFCGGLAQGPIPRAGSTLIMKHTPSPQQLICAMLSATSLTLRAFRGRRPWCRVLR
jgi:hypothetical protein